MSVDSLSSYCTLAGLGLPSLPWLALSCLVYLLILLFTLVVFPYLFFPSLPLLASEILPNLGLSCHTNFTQSSLQLHNYLLLVLFIWVTLACLSFSSIPFVSLGLPSLGYLGLSYLTNFLSDIKQTLTPIITKTPKRKKPRI